ncbi:MAG: S-layer homology domain-containing protein [Eubacteriales bacterium]
MKKTLPKIICLFLLLCLFVCLTGIPAYAAETGTAESSASESTSEKPPLSPAIRILAARSVMRKSGVCGTDAAVTFSQEDFAKVLGYTPSSVVITSLPDRAAGVLKLGTLDIAVNTALSASAMNHLRFVPTDEEKAVTASFTFTAAGKVYTTDTALTCMVYLLTQENSAPAAADLTAATYMQIPLYGTLRAADPESDEMIYKIVRAPKKGTVTVDPGTGAFVYTPDTGKRGSDVFTYRVSDIWGGESALCRVDVEIRRAGEELCYADLENHWCAAAAMLLTEKHIMTGTRVGGINLFQPDENITRGEFLVTAMRAAGYGDLTPCAASMFADNSEIPSYMTGYAVTAYEAGIISGAPADGTDTPKTVLRANDPITRAEAAVIVERLFGIRSSDSAIAVYADMSFEDADAVPAWSADAFHALRAAGILSVSDPDVILDRAQTAVMLAAAYQTK